MDWKLYKRNYMERSEIYASQSLTKVYDLRTHFKCWRQKRKRCRFWIASGTYRLEINALHYYTTSMNDWLNNITFDAIGLLGKQNRKISQLYLHNEIRQCVQMYIWACPRKQISNAMVSMSWNKHGHGICIQLHGRKCISDQCVAPADYSNVLLCNQTSPYFWSIQIFLIYIHRGSNRSLKFVVLIFCE